MCYRALGKTGHLAGRIEDGSLLYLGSIYSKRSIVPSRWFVGELGWGFYSMTFYQVSPYYPFEIMAFIQLVLLQLTRLWKSPSV